jgi:ferredoxin
MAYSITEECRGCRLCVRYCPAGAIQGELKKVHVIDPDLCIECGACGRVCAFGTVLDAEGTVVEHIKPAEWDRPVWADGTCVACNICVQACPVSVIKTKTSRGKVGTAAYPYLADAAHCIGCGFCADSCPVFVIEMMPAVKEQPVPQPK